MKLRAFKNTSKLPTSLVRRIIKFTLPDNVDPSRLSIWVKSSGRRYAGRYYSGFLPHIVIRIGKKFPARLRLYQYGQNKGTQHWLATREEALVYVAAHELRHYWQEHGKMQNSSFPEGRVRNGSKGRYSEIDTEAFAVRKLREWRKRSADQQTKVMRTVKHRLVHQYPAVEREAEQNNAKLDFHFGDSVVLPLSLPTPQGSQAVSSAPGSTRG